MSSGSGAEYIPLKQCLTDEEDTLREADLYHPVANASKGRHGMFILWIITVIAIAVVLFVIVVEVFRILEPSLQEHPYRGTKEIQQPLKESYAADIHLEEQATVSENSILVQNTQSPQQNHIWTAEELSQRAYRWGPYTSHESLNKILASLGPNETRTREWILRSRRNSTTDLGIGVARNLSLPSVPLNKSDLHFELPTFPQGSSAQKYENLRRELVEGKQDRVCEKGNWEDAYERLHEDMMSGQVKGNFLTNSCTHTCGGLADRLIGTTSAFLLSIITGRAISIYWAQPTPVDLVFDSPHVDWSLPWNKNSSTSKFVYGSQTKSRPTYYNLRNVNLRSLDRLVSTYISNWTAKDAPDWITMMANRGLVVRAFSMPAVAPKVLELGLKLDTAWACLTEYLFRPKPAVLDFVAQYSSVFSLPTFFVIGIQIRTGDESMVNGKKLDLSNSLERYRHYFKCAEQVANTYAKPGQRTVYFLITDSQHLRQEALAQFPEKVVVAGLAQIHIEKDHVDENTKTSNLLGWQAMMNTTADMWIFKETDFQIITANSGFGKLPTLMRGRPGSTIQLNRQLTSSIDCGKLDALTSFQTLSKSWSGAK